METLFSSQNYKKDFGIALLFVMFLELLIGGVILPYQENQRARAVADVIGGPVAWPRWAKDIATDIIKIANDVSTKAGVWISTAKALWDKSNAIIKEALAFAWNRLRRMLLNMLVNDIVKWIQGGGKPRFVTDWQSFLKTAGDKAAGDLIDKMGAGFLCSKFSFQLRLALSSPPTFDETATCTLSAAISNIDRFMTNFSQGGWKGWVAISESQNNYMGAYLSAANQKYRVISEAEAAKRNEAAAGNGFLGDNVCVAMTNSTTNDSQVMGSNQGYAEADIPAGYKCTKWETRTPGQIVGGSLQQAVGIDIPWLISAKEFAEYAGAIVDAVINKAIRTGIAAMTPSGEGTSASYGVSGAPVVPGINAPASVSVNLSAYETANLDSAEIVALGEQQGLMEENTGKLIAEKQLNLTALNDIKNQQVSTLNALTDILQAGCSAPASATITTTNTQTTSTCSGTDCPCDAVTVETQRATISGIGESTIRKTITTAYRYNTDEGSCEIRSITNNFLTLSIAPTTNTDIATISTEITNLQGGLPKITMAKTDTLDYQTKATAYMDIYEKWKNGDLAAATSTAGTAMNAARVRAIASNQTALASSSTKFSDFTQETMAKSTALATNIGNTMTARGAITDCGFASISPACLAKDLCTVQGILASYTNSCFSL